MRVRFSSTDTPKLAAKRLSRFPAFWDIPHSTLLELTVHVLGYSSWHEVTQECKKGLADPLDEDLSPAELAARRAYQARRLKEKVPELRTRCESLIESWAPSARRPSMRGVPEVHDIRDVKRARDRFFNDGFNRAFVLFFQKMLDWPLFDVNTAASELQPLAYTSSERMDLKIPLLAPGARDAAPLGIAPNTLDSLVARYPDGAIVLLGEPTVDVVDGHPLFSPGLLVLDGQSHSLTMCAGLANFDSLFEFGENCYRVKAFSDVGEWASRTFAMCRSPSWQADNVHDEEGEALFWSDE
ncbi:hypothetical protein F6X40_34785 [Paraburkholderia sp. UCT31]|uniref:hypothetical protein n=1 Tax=Paraburkholderia sp. UCT31 TaxID=2615209 RepID=UPI001655FB91|nr:hypothetical protein [Paraburkholderia sp. UCT31]MBC8741729.1 hypothetical protein [Paraburkholderia sp. UCT31]